MQNNLSNITGKPYEPPRREYGTPFHRPIVERVLRDGERLGRWLTIKEIREWPNMTDDERARLNVDNGIDQLYALAKIDKRVRDGDSYRRLEYHLRVS